MSHDAHHVLYYACGKHIESQCRCMSPSKPKIQGRTVCPHCAMYAPATAAAVERARRWIASGVLSRSMPLVESGLVGLQMEARSEAIDEVRLMVGEEAGSSYRLTDRLLARLAAMKSQGS